MDDDTTTYTIRLPKDLKNAFEIAAKSDDMTGSQLLRQWMRSYVENYMKRSAQQDLLKPSRGKK